MTLPTLPADSTVSTLREEVVYTHSRLLAHPFAAPHAPGFAAILADCAKVATDEVVLEDAVVIAQAKIDASDDALDSLVDALSNALLLENDNNRSAPEYVQYFGKKRPFEIKRPVLGDELETIRSWIPSLKASKSPTIHALGLQAEAYVATADAAVKAKSEADQALRVFRITGPRKHLIDAVNALRKATYGALAQLPHEPQGKTLPVDFADAFFQHETAKTKTRSIEKVQKRIDAVTAELTALQQELKALEEAAAKKANEEAQEKSDLAALAQAERDEEEAKARKEALRAKLKPR